MHAQLPHGDPADEAIGLVVDEAREVARCIAVVPPLCTDVVDEARVQPVPVLIDGGHLGVVAVDVSGVEQEVSEVVHLLEGSGVDVRVGDDKEQGEKREVGGDLAEDRPHAHLCQSPLTHACHLSAIKATCALRM